MCCTLMLWLSLITLLPSVLPSTEPDLPAPKNVHMDSYNMKHVVRWDAVEVEDVAMPVMYNVGFEMDDPITGTAEQNPKYRGRYSTFLELCVNITKTECDCTEQILPIYRGKPMVRAELGSRRSDWVVLSNFQPSTNTTIGPVKSLVLHSHSGQLTVDFSPPFSLSNSNWQMRYKLTYWKESSPEKVTVDPSFATSYALDNLELNTNYCVQVRAFTHYIEGLASDPVCATTVTDVTLIVVLGCVFGFLLICGVIALLIIPDRPLHLARAKIKTWLDGPYSIPSDIMDYLEDPPHSIPEDCGAQNTTEEHYDTVSIVCMDSSQNITVELLPDPRRPASEKT